MRITDIALKLADIPNYQEPLDENIKLKCNKCGKVFKQGRKFHIIADFLYIACEECRQ